MDKYEQFHQHIASVAETFKKIPQDQTIRLVSHFDADGISSCALVVKLLNLENRKYSLSVVQQLKEETIRELSHESYSTVIFSDLASALIEDIKRLLHDKQVFILDHHEMSEVSCGPNVHLINPHQFDIDGGKEVSGAGVSYLFGRAVNDHMRNHAHIAIVGAMGDMQEHNGFDRLNQEILQDALDSGTMKVIRGLRMFGAQTRPIHKILEYSTDPYIPGVSGNESGAIQFLQQCGIVPKHQGGWWKKVGDLTEEEMKQLVTGVVMRRLGESNPEDVLGNVYLLRNEEEGSPLKDAKEFATLLNACGRLGKASFGIGACIGDKADKERAVKLLTQYKREIVNAINWFHDNKANDQFIEKGAGYMIINSQDNIMPTIIGTLASIVSRGNEVDEGTHILSVAQLPDGSSKASIRISGIRDNPDVDVKKVIDRIVEGVDNCESGGHQHAAGAVFPSEHEEVFLGNARKVLGSLVMEERVN